MLPNYLAHSFKLYSYFAIAEEIIIEVMFKCDTMEFELKMFLAFIWDVVFFEQNFESVLVDFFLETTSKFIMKLEGNSY